MYCVNPINVISINKKLILNPSAAYSVQWLKPLKNTSSSHPVTRGGYWRSSKAEKFSSDLIPTTYFT